MKKLQEYNRKVRSFRKMPELRAGDIVKIHRKIKEGEKERTQVFEGIVISLKGKQSSSPIATVRKVSFGVGVEISVPIYSPTIEKIEIVKRARVRKAKLYYLRRKDFKLSKLKMKELDKFVAEEEKTEIPSSSSKETAVVSEEKTKAAKIENSRKEEINKTDK